jgi:hypothetical protein
MVFNDIQGSVKLTNGGTTESTTHKTTQAAPTPATLLGKFVQTHKELEFYKYVEGFLYSFTCSNIWI